jgi:tyrosinase
LFVDAIKDMKKAPPLGNSGVTNRYDEFVEQHGDFCNHLNSGFLAWHRKLLWDFESEVRALGPKYANFTIPYWNFNASPFPSDLATPGDNAFLGPNGDPNNHWEVMQGPFAQFPTWAPPPAYPQGEYPNASVLCRNFTNIQDLSASGVPASVNHILTADTSFTQMSNDLQTGGFMHNAAHIDVGGQLSDFTSGADDPVFWMLHSYIDMLWTQWEVNGAGSLTSFEQYGGGPGIDDTLSDFGGSPVAGFSLGFDNVPNDTVRDQLNPFDTTYLG